MTVDEVGTGELDLTRHTADVAAMLNVLWGDADVAAVVVDAERRLLAYNAASKPSLADEGVKLGGTLTERLRRVWLDDEVEECPPSGRPLERALDGETVRRQVIRFDTVSFQEQGRLRVSALPITLHDGSRGVMLLWLDISERWLTQRRDRREIRRLEQLLEGASDYAILMLDTAGRVMTWSSSAERMHGYSQEAAIGLPYSAFFTDEDRADGRPERILDAAVARGNERTTGLQVRADGSTFWAQGSVTPMRDDADDLCGFVKVTHDVTEKRRAEKDIVELNEQLRALNDELETRVLERTEQLSRQAAELKAANAELEAFSYSVSHDLRAPLRAMSGYASIIEELFGDELPPEALGYLHKMNERALNMGQLIDGLLSLSRTQRMSFSVERLDMTDLARECWNALANERAERSIDFDVDELPPADGDRRLIGQVWTNLLHNAIKYTGTRADARIHVTATDQDGVTTYRVQDNGVGFDMKYAHKIGQVFQRLHERSEFSGTGVGMAIVQRIVQRHGGAMAIHAEPGTGASMGFSL
jgi:PAS domain S-box-containing protein